MTSRNFFEDEGRHHYIHKKGFRAHIAASTCTICYIMVPGKHGNGVWADTRCIFGGKLQLGVEQQSAKLIFLSIVLHLCNRSQQVRTAFLLMVLIF